MVIITNPSQLSLNLLSARAGNVSFSTASTSPRQASAAVPNNEFPEKALRTKQGKSVLLANTNTANDDRESTASSSACSSECKCTCSNPAQHMERLFCRHGVYTEDLNRPASKPLKPSDEAIDAYDMEITRAVRSGNLDRVKHLHEQEGYSLDASNRFGESILHIACRRGNAAMVDYMISEAHVNPNVCDDMGRTAFHDICWSTRPNCETMDVMLRALSPDELLKKDARGHTPFRHTPQKQWGEWLKYLWEREDYLMKWVRTKQQMLGVEVEVGDNGGDDGDDDEPSN